MPYVMPTRTVFIANFPEFATTADAVIDFALTEAALYVDESWSEQSYALAIQLYAAHILTTAAQQQGGGAIQSVSLGSISISYARSQSMIGIQETDYGRRFVALRRMNVGGPLVV